MIAVITRLLLRRALLAVPLVFAVVALTFFFIRLAPGDPAQILAGDAPTAEFLAQVRAEYGLDRPMWTQFLAFLGKALTGDFGTSLYTKQPVFTVILERFPATVLMTGTAMIVGLLPGNGTNVIVRFPAILGFERSTGWHGRTTRLSRRSGCCGRPRYG